MLKKRDQRVTHLIGLEREAAHTAFREGENAPSLSQQRLLAHAFAGVGVQKEREGVGSKTIKYPFFHPLLVGRLIDNNSSLSQS